MQAIRDGKSDPSQNINNIVHGLAEVREQCGELGRHVKANTETITDDRIPASLSRFDRWFELFLRSQNLRWLVIEFAAPVAFSATALYYLLK